MNIQENIDNLDKWMDKVKNHCLCLSFEDLGGMFRVMYPEGYYPHGVQATYKGIGKGVALERMFNAMERHWVESFPSFKE